MNTSRYILLRAAGIIIAFSTLFSTVQAEKPVKDSTTLVHHYIHTNYAHQAVQLRNQYLQLSVFRRIGGWGWGEIYTASGKFMAVLDHLGEIQLRDQDIPMRLEADSVEKTSDAEGESLIFHVKSVVVKDRLKGTSFEEWMSYPYDNPCLIGEVKITLLKDKPVLRLKYRYTSTGNYFAQYIRGPWLKVGESSFGIKKTDAIFPGIDWAIEDEWSSGQDWFKDPWALRFMPHPYKVSIPLMAFSYKGTGIGLSWDPNQVTARWFNNRSYRPQPVFAVPNFVERANNNLLGLMIPDATAEGHENEVYGTNPVELRIGEMVQFDAEIWLSEGNSLDVVSDWVKRNGLPEPSQPRWNYKETLDRIASAYNSNLWHEGEGFGYKQRKQDRISPYVPEFIERYIRENKKTQLAKELQQKVDKCRSYAGKPARNKPADIQELTSQANAILALQKPDGSFRFDPNGRHYMKDDFRVATSFIEPMGFEDDSALDITILPTLQLLEVAKQTGSKTYLDAAKKALEFCMHMTRPEGGDFWETPLHAPNLFAAGHAAVAYYEGYRLFGEEKYRQKAIYWIRSLLPFTHLWEPSDIKMLYYTKPCLCSSDWYFANWVRDHVQWEVLNVFALSFSHGIHWDEVDKEIDWKRYHEGITNAAINWIQVHTDNAWRPHNLPSTYAAYQRGDYDYCYCDTHNCTTGLFGGMFISPESIVENIYSILDRNKK